MMITIGDQTGKFFSEQEVDISSVALPGLGLGQLVRVHNPSNRLNALTHAVEFKDNVVRIALVFAIDTEEYRQWTDKTRTSRSARRAGWQAARVWHR
jgi:hypothetical protein